MLSAILHTGMIRKSDCFYLSFFIIVTGKPFWATHAEDNYVRIVQETEDIPNPVGEHGYNNSLTSMHPFFMAMGPDFKPGTKVDTFNNVDIYPLMCKLLGLKPAPNNGSLDVVSQLLIEESDSTTFGAYILILLLIGFVGGLFSVAACQVHRQHKRRLRSISSFSLPHSVRYSKSDRMPLMSDTSEEDFEES